MTNSSITAQNRDLRVNAMDLAVDLGLGFGVWGLGFGAWGLGLGVWGLGFRV